MFSEELCGLKIFLFGKHYKTATIQQVNCVLENAVNITDLKKIQLWIVNFPDYNKINEAKESELFFQIEKDSIEKHIMGLVKKT